MLADTFIAFFFAGATALLAASAPVPRDLLEAKDVGVLTCQTTYTGPLQYVNGDDSGFLSFVGPKSAQGLPLLHATRASGEKVPSHVFNFKACTSNKGRSFMGNPPANAKALGHLELADQPGKCVTADYLNKPEGKVHANFVLQDCSFSDDSGQLFQTFALGNTDHVDFLGHVEGMGPDYQLSLSKQKYTNILVKRVDAAGAGLRFKFSS